MRSDVVTLVNVGSAETLPPATLTPPGVEPSPILTVLVSGSIMIEPESKNTAAAILAASIFKYSQDENAVLLVAPSDHVMPDTHDFHEAISIGVSQVKNGKMVTFGIEPTGELVDEVMN